MSRNKVFISYSHKDKKFLEDLQTMLAPLIREGGLLVWDDSRIRAGDLWRKEIDTALKEAAVAVMLVSPSFLASKFISEVELPALLKAAESQKLKVCWVLVSACLYKENPDIINIQAANDLLHPLDTLSKPKLNNALVEIARTINEQYKLMVGVHKDSDIAEKVPTTTGEKAKLGADVFLSYHSGDAKNAQKIRDALQKAEIDVWRDQDSIEAGAQFSIEIEQAIRRSAMLIALITEEAVKSTWVRNEILFAMEYEKNIIPLIMEQGVKMPIEIIGTQNINMTENWDDGLDKLIRRIQFLLKNVKIETAKSALEPPIIEPSRSHQNPFIFGSAVPAELFVERKVALDAISERVGNYYSLQSISIVANRRMGKTSLLNYIWKKPNLVFRPDHAYVTIYIDAMDARTHSVSGFMRILRKSIESQLGEAPWHESDDGNLIVFGEAIEKIAEEDRKRIVLLLDEFESIMAHQELDILLESLRACGSLSRIGIVTSTAHELAELKAEGKLSSPFDNIFQTHYLGNFSESECIELIKRAFNRSGDTSTEDDAKTIRELSGRHPYLTQLAGSILWKAKRDRPGSINVRGEFLENAKDIFGGILQRLNPSQLDAIKQLSGIKPKDRIPEAVLTNLRSRGVLDETNSLFSSCFEEYIRAELR